MVRALLLTRAGQSSGEFVRSAQSGTKLLYLGRGGICDTGKEREPKVLVVEATPDNLPKNYSADIVLIGRGIDRIASRAPGAIKKGAIAVFDQGIFADIGLINEHNLVPISCGTGEKNTITISSLTDETMTVSVQRQITGARGQIIDVQEYLFKSGSEIKDIYMTLLGNVLVLLTEEG